MTKKTNPLAVDVTFTDNVGEVCSKAFEESLPKNLSLEQYAEGDAHRFAFAAAVAQSASDHAVANPGHAVTVANTSLGGSTSMDVVVSDAGELTVSVINEADDILNDIYTNHAAAFDAVNGKEESA